MTTIVATLDRMVSDSQVTDGDESYTLQDKIVRVRDMLVATAGDCEKGDRYVDFLQKRRRTPPKFADTDDFKALILTRQGLFRVHYDCRMRLLRQPFDAIGTGGGPALGALLAGVSAERAVEIACTVDKVNSSLPLQVVHLCPQSSRKKS